MVSLNKQKKGSEWAKKPLNIKDDKIYFEVICWYSYKWKYTISASKFAADNFYYILQYSTITFPSLVVLDWNNTIFLSYKKLYFFCLW